MHFPMSSTDQIVSAVPGPAYLTESPGESGRLDALLDATVALLTRAVSGLGLPQDAADGDDQNTGLPSPAAGRIAADAARLTTAVAQLVRAHHLHAAPSPQAATSQAHAALVALLTELDAGEDQERTRP